MRPIVVFFSLLSSTHMSNWMETDMISVMNQPIHSTDKGKELLDKDETIMHPRNKIRIISKFVSASTI